MTVAIIDRDRLGFRHLITWGDEVAVLGIWDQIPVPIANVEPDSCEPPGGAGV